MDPAQRAKVLFVRVSEATHTAVADRAAAAGMGPGEYVRTLVEREVTRGDDD